MAIIEGLAWEYPIKAKSSLRAIIEDALLARSTRVVANAAYLLSAIATEDLNPSPGSLRTNSDVIFSPRAQFYLKGITGNHQIIGKRRDDWNKHLETLSSSTDDVQVEREFDRIAGEIEGFAYDQDGFILMQLVRICCFGKAWLDKIRIAVWPSTGIIASREEMDSTFIEFSLGALLNPDPTFEKLDEELVRNRDVFVAKKLAVFLETFAQETRALNDVFNFCVTHILVPEQPDRINLILAIKNMLAMAMEDEKLEYSRLNCAFWIRLRICLALAVGMCKCAPQIFLDGGVLHVVWAWITSALSRKTIPFDGDDDELIFALVTGIIFLESMMQDFSGLFDDTIMQEIAQGECFIDALTRVSEWRTVRSIAGTLSRSKRVLLLQLLRKCVKISSQLVEGSATTTSSSSRLKSEHGPLVNTFVWILNDPMWFGASVLEAAIALFPTRQGLFDSATVNFLGLEKGKFCQAVQDLLAHLSTRLPRGDVKPLLSVAAQLVPMLKKNVASRSMFYQVALKPVIAMLVDEWFFAAALSGDDDSNDAISLAKALHTSIHDLGMDTIATLVADLSTMIETHASCKQATTNVLAFTSELFVSCDLVYPFVTKTQGLTTMFGMLVDSNCRERNHAEIMKFLESAISNDRPGPASMSSNGNVAANSLCEIITNTQPSIETPVFDDFTRLLSLAVEKSQDPYSSPREGFLPFDALAAAFKALSNRLIQRRERSEAFSNLVLSVSVYLAGGPILFRDVATRHVVSRTELDLRLFRCLYDVVEAESGFNRPLAFSHVALVLAAPKVATDAFIKMSYSLDSVALLVKLACEAFVNGELSNAAITALLSMLDDTVFNTTAWDLKQVSIDKARFDMVIMVAQNISQMPSFESKRPTDESALLQLLSVIKRIVSFASGWKPASPEEVAPSTKKVFSMNIETMNKIVECGFHPALVKAAMEKLQSNDVAIVTMHLVENPTPMSDDEMMMEHALWLSMQNEPDDQPTTPPGPSFEQLEQMKVMSTCILHVKRRALEICELLLSDRRNQFLELPSEILYLSNRDVGFKEDSSSRPELIDAGEACVFFINQSDQRLWITSVSPNPEQSRQILLNAKEDCHPVRTYVGCVLHVRNGRGKRVAHVVARHFGLVTITALAALGKCRRGVGMLSMEQMRDLRNWPMTNRMFKVDRSLGLVWRTPIKRQIRFVNDADHSISIKPINMFDKWSWRFLDPMLAMRVASPSLKAFTLVAGGFKVCEFDPTQVWLVDRETSEFCFPAAFVLDADDLNDIEEFVVRFTRSEIVKPSSVVQFVMDIFVPSASASAVVVSLIDDEDDTNDDVHPSTVLKKLFWNSHVMLEALAHRWPLVQTLGILDDALINDLIARVAPAAVPRRTSMSSSSSLSSSKASPKDKSSDAGSKKRTALDADLNTMSISRKDDDCMEVMEILSETETTPSKRFAVDVPRSSSSCSPAIAASLQCLQNVDELQSPTKALCFAILSELICRDPFQKRTGEVCDLAKHAFSSKPNAYELLVLVPFFGRRESVSVPSGHPIVPLQAIVDCVREYGLISVIPRLLERMFRAPGNEDWHYIKLARYAFKKTKSRSTGGGASFENWVKTMFQKELKRVSPDQYPKVVKALRGHVTFARSHDNNTTASEFLVTNVEKIENPSIPLYDVLADSTLREFVDLCIEGLDDEIACSVFEVLMGCNPHASRIVSMRREFISKIAKQYLFILPKPILAVLHGVSLADGESCRFIASELVECLKSSQIEKDLIGSASVLTALFQTSKPDFVLALDECLFDQVLLDRLGDFPPGSAVVYILTLSLSKWTERNMRRIVSDAPPPPGTAAAVTLGREVPNSGAESDNEQDEVRDAARRFLHGGVAAERSFENYLSDEFENARFPLMHESFREIRDMVIGASDSPGIAQIEFQQFQTLRGRGGTLLDPMPFGVNASPDDFQARLFDEVESGDDDNLFGARHHRRRGAVVHPPHSFWRNIVHDEVNVTARRPLFGSGAHPPSQGMFGGQSPPALFRANAQQRGFGIAGSHPLPHRGGRLLRGISPQAEGFGLPNDEYFSTGHDFLVLHSLLIELATTSIEKKSDADVVRME